jgi:hypothetical protein
MRGAVMSPDPAIQSELLSYMVQLPADAQARVVDFARTLTQSSKDLPRSTPGKEFLRLAGVISADDLALMERVIEEDCERIDLSEW